MVKFLEKKGISVKVKMGTLKVSLVNVFTDSDITPERFEGIIQVFIRHLKGQVIQPDLVVFPAKCISLSPHELPLNKRKWSVTLEKLRDIFFTKTDSSSHLSSLSSDIIRRLALRRILKFYGIKPHFALILGVRMEIPLKYRDLECSCMIADVLYMVLPPFLREALFIWQFKIKAKVPVSVNMLELSDRQIRDVESIYNEVSRLKLICQVFESHTQKRYIYWHGVNLYLFSCNKPNSFVCGEYPFPKEAIIGKPVLIINLAPTGELGGYAESSTKLYDKVKKYNPQVISVCVKRAKMKDDKNDICSQPLVIGTLYSKLDERVIEMGGTKLYVLTLDLF